jgi:hypothetical protein
MERSVIEKDITSFAHQIRDVKVLQMVRSILEQELWEEEEYPLSEHLKVELDIRLDKYEKGEAKLYTIEQALEMVRSKRI